MDNKETTKNKIISISGQPVTGKSTTVNELTKKLKEKGYSEENIHLVSTGEKFREYANQVVKVAKELQKSEDKSELYKDEKVQELMRNKTIRSAFIKSLIEMVDNKIDLDSFTIEDANNLKEFEAVREAIDKIVDEEIKTLGEEINKEERPDEIWIIDSRLAFHNIPESFAVRLTALPEVAGKRLLTDASRGEEDSNYSSEKEAIQAIEARKTGEQERYLKRYNVDLEDEENYNLIIDTSYSNTEDIADTILACLDKYSNKQFYGKKWTSPKTILPLQNIMETYSGLEEIKQSIEEKGFLPDKPIDVVEYEGYKFIIEGHHRNFGAASAGKTLVPYDVLSEEELKKFYGGGSPIDRVGSLKLYTVYDHEDVFPPDKNFPKGFQYGYIYGIDIYNSIEKANRIFEEKLAKIFKKNNNDIEL